MSKNLISIVWIFVVRVAEWVATHLPAEMAFAKKILTRVDLKWRSTSSAALPCQDQQELSVHHREGCTETATSQRTRPETPLWEHQPPTRKHQTSAGQKDRKPRPSKLSGIHPDKRTRCNNTTQQWTSTSYNNHSTTTTNKILTNSTTTTNKILTNSCWRERQSYLFPTRPGSCERAHTLRRSPVITTILQECSSEISHAVQCPETSPGRRDDSQLHGLAVTTANSMVAVTTANSMVSELTDTAAHTGVPHSLVLAHVNATTVFTLAPLSYLRRWHCSQFWPTKTREILGKKSLNIFVFVARLIGRPEKK